MHRTRVHGAQVPEFLFLFLFLVCYNSIVQKLSFKLKLNFEKIEFQNNGISLISLGKWAKCWFFCIKKAFAHFGPFFGPYLGAFFQIMLLLKHQIQFNLLNNQENLYFDCEINLNFYVPSKWKTAFHSTIPLYAQRVQTKACLISFIHSSSSTLFPFYFPSEKRKWLLNYKCDILYIHMPDIVRFDKFNLLVELE